MIKSNPKPARWTPPKLENQRSSPPVVKALSPTSGFRAPRQASEPGDPGKNLDLHQASPSLCGQESQTPAGAAGEGNPGPEDRGQSGRRVGLALGGLTDQDEDTDQEGDEGAGAEGGGHDEGRGVAGLDGARAVAAADADGQRPRTAQRGRPAVHHQDGQEEHVLLLPVEAHVLRVHRGRVVCFGESEGRVTRGQPCLSRPLPSPPWDLPHSAPSYRLPEDLISPNSAPQLPEGPVPSPRAFTSVLSCSKFLLPAVSKFCFQLFQDSVPSCAKVLSPVIPRFCPQLGQGPVPGYVNFFFFCHVSQQPFVVVVVPDSTTAVKCILTLGSCGLGVVAF